MNINNIYQNGGKIAQDREADYKKNMEILASIKSLPGKLVYLGSNDIFSKTLGDQKKKNKISTFTEDSNFSNRPTSLSCHFKEDFPKNNEKSMSQEILTGSTVFKPIPIPLNRNIFSSNNGYQFNGLLNLIPPNYLFNNYNNFVNYPRPFIFQNDFIRMNPISNVSEINLLKDSLDFLLFLQKKRNHDFSETSEKKEPGSKIEDDMSNPKKQESNSINEIKKVSEISKFPFSPALEKNKQIKKLFNVIPKSNYVYRKRKPKKKKIYYKGNDVLCEHEGCEGRFKTKKQAVFHHYKMNVECYNDTINLLKMISETKKLLLKDEEKREDIFCKYSTLYEETMKQISLNEHIDTITGFEFKDIISED